MLTLSLEALADYDSVLSVEPDNVDALVGLAWVKFCTSAMMVHTPVG